MRINTKLLSSIPILAATLPSLAQTYPRFTTQPTNQTVNQSFSASFGSAALTTNPPVSYQWYFNSNAIPWALTNFLTITNAQPGDAGNYFVVASDGIASATSHVATLTVIPPAVLDPKLGANIRLSDDPPELPSTRRSQTEPHLARSFEDPNILVATCMEGSDADGGALGCGYTVSTNGGLTWSRRALIPGLTTLKGGVYNRIADPVGGIDLSGNLFIITLPWPLSGKPSLFISRSADGGQSFLPTKEVWAADGTYDSDKDWIAINNFRGSATSNRIAVAFTREGGSNQVHCTYSDDAGGTWSTPVPLGSRDATFALPFFFRDGSLGVLYQRFMHGYMQGPPVTYEFVRSEDGGMTFGKPILALDPKGDDYADPIAFAFSAQTACVAHQAGVIYAAVPVWYGPATNRAPRILLTKSIDMGLTWSQAVPVNDTPARKAVFLPTIAASPDGQHVMITFYDKRNDTGQGNLVDLYLAESFDGGDTWEPNLRLTEFSSDLRKAPLIFNTWRWLGDYFGLVPGLNLDLPAVAVWIDNRAGNNDPYAIRINRTKGTTFDTWRKLRWGTNDLANLAISGETADPDGDGIPNLAEYAFGLEPTHADAEPLTIEPAPSASGAIVLASYERLAVLSDIQFTWERSVNLLGWTPASPTEERSGPGREPWFERVEASFPAAGQIQFFRLALRRVPH